MSKRRSIAVSVIVIIAAASASFGIIGLAMTYMTTHTPVSSIATDIVTHSTTTPSETRPAEACESYTVPANQPRKIEAKAIGLDACIQRVGVDQHNAIAVPDNIYVAGWYVNSVSPGQLGVSIIDGHVLGRYNDAIFKDLGKLKPKDIIRIQYGDLSGRSFAVIDTNSYATEEVMAHLLTQMPDVERQLNLVTCDGTFDSREQTYDRRLIVRASSID